MGFRKMGKLIVIEGACDGIGKTTQYKLLKKYLEDKGYNVCSHHFPTYDSKQGKLTEYYLNGDFGNPNDLSPYLVNSIYAVDRSITWNDKLKAAYDKGDIILLDRYTTSSLIYQSSLFDNEEDKKAFINYVTDYEYNKLGIKKPDKVIFLTADFDLVSSMRSKRKSNDGVKNDVYERDSKLMKKIYDNAMFVSDYLDFDIVKCDLNGSLRSIEDIHNEIKGIMDIFV